MKLLIKTMCNKTVLHESQAVLTALREHQLHVHVVFLMCCTDQEEENKLDRNFKKHRSAYGLPTEH